MYAKRWKYVGKKVDPFYKSAAWLAFRIRILQRDYYWCQVCNKRFANTVHHKIPRTERPDLALDEDNCESICAICHNQEHPEKGRKGQRKKEAPEGVRVESFQKKGGEFWKR